MALFSEATDCCNVHPPCYRSRIELPGKLEIGPSTQKMGIEGVKVFHDGVRYLHWACSFQNVLPTGRKTQAERPGLLSRLALGA